MNDLLGAIHERRGFFLGTADFPFTSLVAFLAGYQCGYEANKFNLASPSNMIPRDFSRFVEEKYHRAESAGGWQIVIEEIAGSQEAAFQLFFQLLSEYKAVHPS
jgi:hypothetical protein